jgi:predicted permease
MKSFANPMLIGMLIGLVIGLTGLRLPSSVLSVIDVAGDCMSPVAMLLTGLTIGRLDLWALLRKGRLYLTTAVKLLLYPLVFFGIFLLLPKNGFFSESFFKCAMCIASMPMGLNTIVIPAAYGKDTTDAAGLALVSHVLSILTIPLAFLVLQIFIL